MNRGSVDCWVSECFVAQRGLEKNQSVRVHVEVCTQGREQRKLRAHEDYTNKMNCYAQSLLNHVAVWVLQNRSYVFDIMSYLREGGFHPSLHHREPHCLSPLCHHFWSNHLLLHCWDFYDVPIVATAAQGSDEVSTAIAFHL